VSGERSDASLSAEPATHGDRVVGRLPGGGFALEASAGESIRVLPVSGGWKVEGPSDITGWQLARSAARGERFLLGTADGREELGRTTTLDESDPIATSRYLLAGDGRMFRIVLRGPAEGRFELLGWETPGAYLTACVSGDGWVIAPAPASSGLLDIRPLLILFAAEVLDSD
jgi:hypothetical protein